MNAKMVIALKAHLSTMDVGHHVVDDQLTIYKPTAGTPYVEARFLTGATNTLYVNGGRRQYQGILQLTAVVPKSWDLVDAMQLADDIIAHFPAGTRLLQEDSTLKVMREPSQATPFPDGAWLRVPVSVSYTGAGNSDPAPVTEEPVLLPPAFLVGAENAPVVDGEPIVGATLTVTFHGNWAGGAIEGYTYQWKYGEGVNIEGAVAFTYDIEADYIGELISCRVQPYNAAGSTGRLSNQTGPIEAA